MTRFRSRAGTSLVAALAAAVLLAGCGGRADLGEDPQAAPAGATAGGGSEEAQAEAARTLPAATSGGSGGGSPEEADPSGAPVPEPDAAASGPRAGQSWGDASFPLAVTVAPPCVARGGTLAVTIQTRPRASVAAAVSYADEEAHGALTVGDADGTGAFRWQVVVSPDAPEGPAEALVSAQDRTPSPDGESASTTGEHRAGRYPFEVDDRC